MVGRMLEGGTLKNAATSGQDSPHLVGEVRMDKGK